MKAPELISLFNHQRQHPLTLVNTARQVLHEVLGEKETHALYMTPLGHSIEQLATAVDKQSEQSITHPFYHNVAHFQEAVIAIAQIAAKEFSNNPEKSRLVALGVLTMIGHDYMHDGTINTPTKSLEAISWAACEPILNRAGLSTEDSRIIQSLILKTDNALRNENKARYLQTLPPSNLGREVDQLALCCMEADTAASLLPGTSQTTAQLLSQEWKKAGIEAGNTCATWKDHLGFLNFIACETDGAKALGLESARTAQIQVFDRIANSLQFKKPEDAAIYLDRIDAEQGRTASLSLFAKTLHTIDPSLARCAFPSLIHSEDLAHGASSYSPNLSPPDAFSERLKNFKAMSCLLNEQEAPLYKISKLFKPT